VADHVAALDAHVGPGVFPIVLANANLELERDLPEGVEMVRPDVGASPRHPAPAQVSQVASGADTAYRLVTDDLVDRDCPWRHDPARLSLVILGLYQAERRG